jgi:hypothetical protein
MLTANLRLVLARSCARYITSARKCESTASLCGELLAGPRIRHMLWSYVDTFRTSAKDTRLVPVVMSVYAFRVNQRIRNDYCRECQPADICIGKKLMALFVTGRRGTYGCATSRLPHFLDNRLTEGGEVVSLTHLPPFTPRKIPNTHCC